MFLANYMRGMDSTGLASIRTAKEDHRVIKIPSNPIDLFDMTSFRNALNGPLSMAFIGHNRAATRGRVTKANAHPFEYGSVIGVHNGTLEPLAVKALEEKLGQEFEVDSEAIIASLDKFGAKETIGMLEGAWALVWYDGKDNTLNFIRNDERPLWFAFSEEFDRIFWASEYPFIEMAAKCGGDKLYMDKEYHRFWMFPEDVLYSFDLDALRASTPENRTKPKIVELKGTKYVKPSYVYTSGGQGADPFGRGSTTGTTGSKTRITPSTSAKSGSSSRGLGTAGLSEKLLAEGKPTLIIANDLLPFGNQITSKQFFDMTPNGCSFCSNDITFSEEGITVYKRGQHVLCPKCSGSTTNRVYVPRVA